jgi:RHS repeat-associated protein
VAGATITAAAGDTIERWSVTARDIDGGAPFTLASGQGAPPQPLAIFDPTTLRNAIYEIRVRAVSAKGESGTVSSTAVVAGDMKLGDYTTRYHDMDVFLGGIPVEVWRSYDTKDRRQGEMGHGWRLELSSYRATPNGRLGHGGWSATPSGFPFTQLRFSSSKAHFVTVTAPDGATQVFDLAPASSGPLLGLTVPTFKAQPGTGTTARLEDVDRPVLAMSGGSLRGFLTGELYDPKRFRLITADGTALVIDRTGGLRSITDRRGNELIFNENGVRSTTTSERLAISRDGADRITRLTTAADRRIDYEYDEAGDLVGAHPPNATGSIYAYNDRHQLVRASGAEPALRLEYDADGRLEAAVDGTGNRTVIDSDAQGRLETITGPDPRLTTITTYDEGGREMRRDRLAGGRRLTESFAYDSDDRLIERTDPTGTTTIRYDASGRQSRVVDPDGVVHEVTRDAFGNVLEQRKDGHLVASSTYDSAGQRVKVSYPDGTAETTRYDEDGFKVQESDRAGRIEQYTYDDRGQLSTLVTAEGTTRYLLDGDGRLITEISPSGSRRSTTYTAFGKPSTTTDGSDRTTHYEYDAEQRLVEYTDPRGKTRRYGYDAAGRVGRNVNRAGQSLDYKYGPDGQVTDVTGSDGTHLTVQYDGFGRSVRLTNGESSIDLGWDDGDRPVSRIVDIPGLPEPVTLRQTWTATGSPLQLGDPHGTTTYTYGDRGLLKSVADSDLGDFGYEYDAAARLSRFTRPNGTSDTFSWHGTDLVEQVTVRGSTILNRFGYTYDASGRVDAFDDADGTHDYTYDADGQLTAATHPAASALPAEAYTYDKNGNRTSWPGHPAAGVEYDSANRLITDGSTRYSYDDEGRLVAKIEVASGDRTTYIWNALDQLVKVTTPAHGVTYGYDALGDRTSTTVDGVQTYTIYDDQHTRRLVLGADGTVLARFVADGSVGGELAVHEGTTARYPILDFQNTLRVETDSEGTVTRRQRYGTFGASADVARAGDQWHGMPAGADGLLLTWARPYDPATGRFASEDPVLAPNLYAYAVNNPCQVSDALGLTSLIETTLARCKDLIARGLAKGELHHIISNFALKHATSKNKAVIALIPAVIHKLTNNYGGWTNSRFVRMLELAALEAGDYAQLLTTQTAILMELSLTLAVAPVYICR